MVPAPTSWPCHLGRYATSISTGPALAAMMVAGLEDPMTLSLPIEDEANELLSRSPLALLTAMLLDQQVPFEKAFSSPYQLTLRLGHEPTAQEIAEFAPEGLAEVFAERPALHR